MTTSANANASARGKRITDVYKAAAAVGRPVVSFEIFPPRGELSDEAARQVAGELAPLGPDFVSVTYSAGGSGNEGRAFNATNQVSALIQDEFSRPTMAHLTCINATPESLEAACEDMRRLGIANVLALRGDITPNTQPGRFKYAKDIIGYLKDQGFCVGAAAYPEGHIDCADPRVNIEHLKAKQDAGADFFITQLFFQNELFYRFRERAVAGGVNVPISCGVMPFMTKKQLSRMVFMCGASLPSGIVKLVARYEDDKEALQQAGCEYAAAQFADLAANDADGLHLYTMNRPAVAASVMQRLNTLACARG